MNPLNRKAFPRILQALTKERLVLTCRIETKEEAPGKSNHVSIP